jgi:hypothetical protein
MRIYMLIFLLITTFNTPINSRHQTYKTIKSKLKLLPEKSKQLYANDIGSICEFIAKEIIAKKYRSSHYMIKTNIAYGDHHKRILGELDIVVFNRSSRRAALLIEVKCRKDQQKALSHGYNQLKRFKNIISESLELDEAQKPIIHRGATQFTLDQFDGVNTQVMMPKQCDGCPMKPYEFDLTLDDVKNLQTMLLNSTMNSTAATGAH